MMLMASIALAAMLQTPAPAAVPMSRESWHRKLFSNRFVTVYDVTLPPGALMRYHSHPTNHLAVVLEPGDLRNEVVGRAPKLRPTGPAGTVVYIAAGLPHRQANVGPAAIHFLAVEILTRPARSEPGSRSEPATGGEQAAVPDDRPGCGVALETGDVRVWRCRQTSHGPAPGHQVRGPWLRVPIRPGAVSASSARWHDARDSTAAADDAFEHFVDIEWK